MLANNCTSAFNYEVAYNHGTAANHILANNQALATNHGLANSSTQIRKTNRYSLDHSAWSELQAIERGVMLQDDWQPYRRNSSNKSQLLS